MNKEKIKNWINEHKYELATAAIYGATSLLIYGCGIHAGKKKAYKRIDKTINNLGEYTYMAIGREYTIKDLGKVGLDSLKDVTCPDLVDENSKINGLLFFYDAK